MADLALVTSVALCSIAGAMTGFGAGLVPGLHMNNIAAAMTAYSGTALALFALIGRSLGSNDAELLIACFISAALVGHLFAESITSTYLGIPAGDVVSVLPAHRLARAGMGDAAVCASADGSLAGLLTASLLLVPLCLLMGSPVGAYRILGSMMGFVMVFFSAMLLYTEGFGRRGAKRARAVLKASLIFAASGSLGIIVLCTEFNACRIPEILLSHKEFVLRSSLLLPMFAGLYGVPGLVLGLRSENVMDSSKRTELSGVHRPSWKDSTISIVGGMMVGWMPGMTAGSSATVCAPSMRESAEDNEVRGSLRFIWLYSSISASGAVFAVGALFMILRARSGCMDAAQFFLDGRIQPDSILGNLTPLTMMLVAMLIAAFLGHLLISVLNPRLHRIRSVLLPPLAGIRRIQLMGCLLVPITMKFFGFL